MTNFTKSVFYISVCIVLGTSCKEEAVSALDYGDSYGSWILDEAIKDGKVTKTLEGTTFNIDTAILSTNLFGIDKSYNYERNGSQLKLTENEMQLFTVSKSTPDTLILNMVRKRKTFQFLMLRNNKIEQ